MCGFLSNDPLFSSLRSFGYNAVRLPKSTIKPLQLYTKKGNELHRLGELSKEFVPRGNIGYPKILEGNPAPNISGKKSGELSLGLGLSMIFGVITSLGGITSGLDAKYQQANSIIFQYENVLEDSVEIIELDKFLNDADINPFSKYVAELLDSDSVYVTTSTLKTCKLAVFPKAKKEVDLDMQIPEIQSIVGPNIKVSSRGDTSSAMTFEGKTPLVFGFQAMQLFYNKGCYTRQKPAERKVVMLGPKRKPGTKLLSEGPFINLAE